MEKYNFQKIEKKWQNYWKKNNLFKVKDDTKKKKFYILDMFPYPSGAGLHVGHPKGYVATDIYARFMRLRGYNVLHPMGFDSFGLPAENYAIKHKINPSIGVLENIKRYKKQLSMFGFNYDWDREIITSDPEYYKWTQWIFREMFKAGLAYESNEPVNWCPKCKTVLSNEDLEDGKCERCDSLIEKRPLRQWVLKMTDYAQRLLDDLKLVNWEKSIIEQQINWIGRSEGSLIKFKIQNSKFSLNSKSKIQNEFIKIFTTRADTLFGATYMVVAPEHEIISNFKNQILNIEDVEKYIQKASNKSDLERTDLAKEKTGVEVKGLVVINPANNKKLPIYVADYVLSSYGTGAIMAVPAHDERDWEFAKKYNLPITQVIKKTNNDKLPFIDEGKLINSGEFNNLDCKKAQKLITKLVSGKLTTKYKMRDWVFSRQRYWGEPFPLVFCKHCAEKITNQKLQIKNVEGFNKGEILNPGWIVVDEKDLPVTLPEVKSYEPTGTGESPLANITEWVNTICPKCGGKAKRETNTMPQWAGSSWYYIAYVMRGTSNFKFPISKYKNNFNEWLPVNFYVGGAEHATRHLLYARFWHKFLYDIGVVNCKEPFQKLQHVGLINGEDGRKMSKRWGNVVNPDDIINNNGADAFRMYIMFMGPFAEGADWSTDGVKGTKRFLDRIWQLFHKVIDNKKELKNIRSKTINKAIQEISEDIEKFSLNTAISKLMIHFNNRDFAPKIGNNNNFINNEVDLVAMKKFLILLSPFAPHISEDLWQKMGEKNSIYYAKWPEYENNTDDQVKKIAIMVNGKTRGVIEIDIKKSSKDKIIELAKKQPNVSKNLYNKKIIKQIYISGKIVSFVVK